MVRKAIAHDHLLEYLKSTAKGNPITFGLILGQPSEEKDYILHLARTPLTSVEFRIFPEIKSVSQIPELAIAQHAEQTTRMLPGGLYVLGIFIATEENLFKPLDKKCLSILQSIQSILAINPWLYGNQANFNERLVLHFKPKKLIYEAMTLHAINGTINNVNLQFNDAEISWCRIQCKFAFGDNLTFISHDHLAKPLKTHFKTITAKLNSQLEKSIFIFNGKIFDEKETIHCANSKHQKQIEDDEDDEPIDSLNSINAVVLLPPVHHINKNLEIFENAGSICILGQIASSVWLNRHTTYKVVSRAIIEDIVRSFQSRLSMHFDSLTEGEGTIFSDTFSMHEPPRRVEITLPDVNLSLSEYLFPGEGAQAAQNSFQDIMDVRIVGKFAVKDVEGQADLEEYYNELENLDSDSDLVVLPADVNKFYYSSYAIIAICIALVSLLFYYVQLAIFK